MLEIPLLYKDRRLEGETTLRQCQLVQLHLLYVFDAICKEYDLTYFLGGGTLLGAMRHGGFIPWDDDLDVGMPMKDYKKFLKIAPKVLPKDVLLQTPITKPCGITPFSKLRDCYSFYYEVDSTSRTNEFAGIFIDIFPYEEMPNLGKSLVNYMRERIYFYWIGSKAYLWPNRNNYLEILIRLIKGMVRKLQYRVFRAFFALSVRICPSGDVALILESGFKCTYQKNMIYPTSYAMFEGKQFPIPNDSEAFLTAQYGNWQEIPPPEKRPRHTSFICPFNAQDLPESRYYPIK